MVWSSPCEIVSATPKTSIRGLLAFMSFRPQPAVYAFRDGLSTPRNDCSPLLVERSAAASPRRQTSTWSRSLGPTLIPAVHSHTAGCFLVWWRLVKGERYINSAIDRLPGWALSSNASRMSFDDSIPVRMIDLFVDTLGRDELRGGANDCRSAIMPAIPSVLVRLTSTVKGRPSYSSVIPLDCPTLTSV